MQISDTLTTSAFRAGIDALKRIPRNCWNFMLETAENEIGTANNVATQVRSATRRNRRTTASKAATAPSSLGDQIVAFIERSPGVGFAKDAIKIAGAPSNTTSRVINQLAKQGRITLRDGLYYANGSVTKAAA